ncbi:MAG TPA: hypothetical protein VFZ78_02680 [Flavisolibacter sp.]
MKHLQHQIEWLLNNSPATRDRSVLYRSVVITLVVLHVSFIIFCLFNRT